MEARLSTAILVSGLMRLAESEGGFAAVIAKGDQIAGSVLVILNEKGKKKQVLERILQPDGQYLWQDVFSQTIDNKRKLETFLARRREYDPDLWLIELDVASAERFAAEMNFAD